ncbi:hypothetical protein ACFYOV_33575 [Streptomyces sp. NPDC005931]|uniref:hypothetical protein n=1 Tax=Streptomyces sp. NPDC005931 TaxID=3364737 RepID=UPI0036A5A72B
MLHLRVLRCKLPDRSLFELGELVDHGLLAGETRPQFLDLVLESFGLSGARVSEGSGLLQSGQAALELSGEVLVGAGAD